MLATHTTMTHIPYKGASEAMTGLLGGQIDVLMSSMASLGSQAKGGKIRLLAVRGDRRLPAFSAVPTFAEAGVGEFGILNFIGLWAPKGIAPEVVAKLQAETAKAADRAEVRSFFEAQGALPGGTNTETFAKLIADTTNMWGAVAAKANVEKQ